MNCKKCGEWFYEYEDGSYYEGDNFVEKYIGTCPKCRQTYTWEYVRPIVKSTLRNFQEL